MAVVEDVQDELVSLIDSAIYPDGKDAAPSTPTDCMIYAGWPTPDQLDRDLTAEPSITHVSVFVRPEERNTTRGVDSTQTLSINGDMGTGIKAIRQQEQLFQITIWAATPDTRKAVSRVVDTILAKNVRISLVDGSMAMLVYRNSLTHDTIQKAQIFRKELFYFAEYATTVVDDYYVIKENTVNITPQ